MIHLQQSRGKYFKILQSFRKRSRKSMTEKPKQMILVWEMLFSDGMLGMRRKVSIISLITCGKNHTGFQHSKVKMPIY